MLTKIPGVPDSSTAIPGMAFFAGTGPEGKTCGDCAHRGYQRESGAGRWRSVTGCEMFKKLAGRHGPPIDSSNRSCRYFEQKAK